MSAATGVRSRRRNDTSGSGSGSNGGSGGGGAVERSYYDVLGINRSASAAEIKSAYLRMAKLKHPDRNSSPQAADEFREVKEAHEVLGSKANRHLYDLFGRDGLKGSLMQRANHSRSGSGTWNRWGRSGSMSSGGGSSGGAGSASMAAAVAAAAAAFRPRHPGSSGGSSGGFTNSRFGSGGRGANSGEWRYGSSEERRSKKRKREEDVTYNLKLTLEELQTGLTKTIQINRPTNPDGSTVPPKRLQIQIAPGTAEGATITYEHEVYADVHFVIQALPHDVFTRDGHNLIHTAEVSLRQALLGGHVSIQTLDGRELDVMHDYVTPETVVTLPGEGMVKQDSPTGERGDLLVKFAIRFPEALSEEQQTKLEDVFEGGGVE